MARHGGLTAYEALAIQGAGRSKRDGKKQGGGVMGAILGIFPLILVPVLIYNLIAFGGSMLKSSAAVREQMEKPALHVTMASQETTVVANVPAIEHVQWVMTWGDLLVLIGLLLLFVGLLKSTSTGTSAIFNHALSMLVFIVCLVEFLLNPAFATSTFFLIMVMSLLDVLAGVIVTIVSARRDVELDKN
jgi:hypothetical protein